MLIHFCKVHVDNICSEEYLKEYIESSEAEDVYIGNIEAITEKDAILLLKYVPKVHDLWLREMFLSAVHEYYERSEENK